MDPKAFFDALEKSKISVPCPESKHDYSVIQPVTQLLYRLSYFVLVTKVCQSSSFLHVHSLKVNCVAFIRTFIPNVRSLLIIFPLKFRPLSHAGDT